MGSDADYLRIIEQAQLGNRDSMSRIAKEARRRVFVYIYRVTLDYHLAQDLSQDTVLEMLKSLKRLKVENTNLLWSWLYRTALGKIQHHFRCQGSRRIDEKTVFDGGELLTRIPKDHQDELNELLKKELSQVVLKTMGQMKTAYRNILALRCFDQMSYTEIVQITGGTEMQARLLFFRAKHLLKKQLAQNGFKKEHLLPAIGLFGAITLSSTKPVSAAVTVSSTAAEVGVTAAVIGTATSKAGIIAVAAVAIAALTTIGTVKVARNDAAVPLRSNESVRSVESVRIDDRMFNVVNTNAFERPTSLIRAYDPNGGDWKGADYRMQGRPVVSVSPKRLLVDPRQQSNFYLVVILPKDHWLELGFSGEIVDGPGIDVYFDGRAYGEQPLVFITDGAGQEIQITSTPVYSHFFSKGYRLTGFDISGLSLPFKPRALRFVGTNNEGNWGGAELYAVRARVSR
jgi:RNA polymerase sigma-70 factor (ECF subfamily)